MIAQQWINSLQLSPHPEGGFYRRTYTADDNSFSSILFMLLRDNFSAFHRIRSEEQWNWYAGDDIIIHEITLTGNYIQTTLSGSPETANFQYVVKGGHWFASECKGDAGYALCGCTVVPAFDFKDFELAEREKLAAQFPQHAELILNYTR